MNGTLKPVRRARLYWLLAFSVLLVNGAGSAGAHAARPADERPVDARTKQGPTIKHGATTQRSSFTPLTIQPKDEKPQKGRSDWKKLQR